LCIACAWADVAQASNTSEGAVSATLTESQQSFLSTASPSATLDIHNGTAKPVTYGHDAFCLIVTAPQGYTYPFCIGNAPGTVRRVQIAPGQTYSVAVWLPRCAVFCPDPSLSWKMRLAAQFVVSSGLRSIPVKTNFVTYRIVPDPNATFQGVDGNRPLLVAIGEGRAELPADALAISFPVTIRPKDVDAIVRAFQAHGLYVQTAGAPAHWIVVAGRTSATADVIASVKAIQPIVGAGANAYRQTLGTFPDGPYAFAAASADLDQKKRALARAFGEDSTRGSWYGLPLISADETWWLGYDDSGERFRYGPQSGIPVDAPTAGPVPQLVPVAVRVSETDAGATLARMPALLVPDAAFYRGPASSGLARFTKLFAIATDRTELYAAAGIARRDAKRLDVDAIAASLVLARRRLERFAAVLGVPAGVTTMGASYPSLLDGSQEIVTTGIAAVVDDQTHAAWRGVSTYDARAPDPDTPGSGSSFVPIAPPDRVHSTTVRSVEQRLVVPEFVRLDVSVPQRARMPGPQALLRRLHGERGVVDVALETPDHPWDAAIGYELLLASPDTKRIPAIVDDIRAYYRLANGAMRTAAVPSIANCERLEDELTMAAATDATERAALEARNQRVRLRKLALGTVHPLLTGDAACSNRAEPLALERSQGGRTVAAATGLPAIVSLEVDLSFWTVAMPR
jgi:hypothetical protein